MKVDMAFQLNPNLMETAFEMFSYDIWIKMTSVSSTSFSHLTF